MPSVPTMVVLRNSGATPCVGFWTCPARAVMVAPILGSHCLRRSGSFAITGRRQKGTIFDRNFDKCSLAGRQRATRPGDENVHSGAAGGGCHWVVVPHGIMVKTGIDKMEDLKGKSIAGSGPGAFPDMLARVALAKFNIVPSDVTLAAVGGDRDRYTALVGGVVDAAVVSNEYLPLASSKNLKMLLEGRDALPNFLRICMFSSGKVLAQRREDAIRYLGAQSKALRYALTHRDETIKLTAEATDAKADDPRAAFVFDDAVKVGAIAPDLPLPMDKLAWMQAQMVELGQIPKAGDLAKMV